ncbi:MAG: zf-TFIIB domain-containing protein [Acidobacteria bacterium]|nr:zf-TFIIB domain-containing protein [Acidobacteriota bacterium]
MVPKQSEEEWFAKFEIQMIRDAQRKRAKDESDTKQEPEKLSNYMLCPKDGTELKPEKIGEIEIDICEKCGGIWLDRGELEEIILAKASDKKGFFRKVLGMD